MKKPEGLREEEELPKKKMSRAQRAEKMRAMSAMGKEAMRRISGTKTELYQRFISQEPNFDHLVPEITVENQAVWSSKRILVRDSRLEPPDLKGVMALLWSAANGMWAPTAAQLDALKAMSSIYRSGIAGASRVASAKTLIDSIREIRDALNGGLDDGRGRGRARALPAPAVKVAEVEADIDAEAEPGRE
jgi:hypothetical protein